MASRPFSSWLNRRPRAGRSRLGKEELQLMRESADRIWRFFHDWSSASTNWLIPDSVREDGGVDLRLSPTNLAMLLNARIAAVHLGVMPLAEFVFATRQTLDQVIRLPKHRGHLLNWYDIPSLEPLYPRVVSTVDSGNLAASLWTLKQAALALAAESAGQARRYPGTGVRTALHCGGLGPTRPGNGFSIPVPAAQESTFRGLRSRHRAGSTAPATTCWLPKRASPALWPSPKATFPRNRGSGLAARSPCSAATRSCSRGAAPCSSTLCRRSGCAITRTPSWTRA